MNNANLKCRHDLIYGNDFEEGDSLRSEDKTPFTTIVDFKEAFLL